jgi:peptidoglycan/LPS O-acetylase OafA/YrhL
MQSFRSNAKQFSIRSGVGSLRPYLDTISAYSKYGIWLIEKSSARVFSQRVSVGSVAVLRFLGSYISNALRDLITPPAQNVPGLDVLRSVAVLMVLMHHCSKEFTNVFGRGDPFAKLPFVVGGWRGVDLFFVLSGYLIGRQLWRELRTTETIDLVRFIAVRRGLRIWPLYYFCIALWLVGSRAGRASFSSFSWWPDAAFLSNYFPGGVVLGAWSLCVEEQFYLLAPLIILAFARFAQHRDPSAFRPWLIALLVSQPIVRAYTLMFAGHKFSNPSDTWASIYGPIHTHADGLLLGLLLANMADNRLPTRPRRAIGFLIVAVLLAAVGRKAQQLVFDSTGAALIFGSVTWLVLSLPRPQLSIFGSRIFFVTSRLAFGIYLNQQLMLEWITPAQFGRYVSLSVPLSVANVSFAGIVGIASFAGALLTYCLCEWPFLKLRNRLLHRRKGHAMPSGPGELVPSIASEERGYILLSTRAAAAISDMD